MNVLAIVGAVALYALAWLLIYVVTMALAIYSTRNSGLEGIAVLLYAHGAVIVAAMVTTSGVVGYLIANSL